MSLIKNKYPWSGIILILFGIALLLNQTRVIDIRFSQILWTGLGILGFVLTVKGFTAKQNGKVFWGTVIFLASIYFLFKTFGFICYPYYRILPVFLVIFGFAFLMLFINNTREIIPLIFSIILFVAGAAFILTEMGYLYRWDVWYVIRHYWPIILILLGFGLLLRRR